ncbi:MAG: 2-oxo acid dehydrogenase subunit E2 [Phycisphaerales bacterium]|nr:2-oxo acid dehydrogenase subunit E2 [Phycisphaerales bacterium]
MSDTVDFILPDLGEGVHEAEIISWKVSVGDKVEEMQVLAEMETDKALVEVPSPYAGKVEALHGDVGQIAHVGEPIVTFSGATQSGKTVKGNGAAPKADHHVETKADAKPQGAGPARASGGVDAAEQTEREDAGTVVGSMEGLPTLGGGGKVMATPAVRRLARDKGIDINTIQGTGRGGRVTASDVERAAQGGGRVGAAKAPAGKPREAASGGAAIAAVSQPISYPPVQVDASGTSQTIPFTGIRRKIAEALDRSVKTAVHFTVMDAADVTALDRVRRQQAHASGEKVSFLPFIIQAMCRALKQFPQLNAVVDDEKREIYIKGVINMGVAVDTDHGLMVPVIPGADRMGILPLGRAINDVAAKCKSRTIGLDQLKGGTITISNVGSYGGAFATPIINYPEVAILAAGRAREAVMARNGGIFVGKEMPLSLSCDHRVVDGAYGAKMLNAVVQFLENPEILLEPAGR